MYSSSLSAIMTGRRCLKSPRTQQRRGATMGKRANVILVVFLSSMFFLGCGRNTPTPTKVAYQPTTQVVSFKSNLPTFTPRPTITPKPTRTPAITPQTQTWAMVNTDVLNIRTGPSTAYSIQGKATRGNRFPVIVRNPDNSWLYISTNSFSGCGWVFAGLTTVEGQLDYIPVVDVPTPTPPSPTTPTQTPARVSPVACNIKGNISYTTGEKIYHLPGCPYYDATIINEAKGERWFCTEAEAQAAGWRKAYNCP